MFSRSADNRAAFVARMQPQVKARIVAVDTPEAVARGADLICLATGSNEPVLFGEWLEPGQHVISIVASNKGVFLQGSVSRPRREFDDAVIARADRIVATLKEQAIMDEQADLFEPVTAGITSWDKIADLGELVAGKTHGRRSPQRHHGVQAELRPGRRLHGAGQARARQGARGGRGDGDLGGGYSITSSARPSSESGTVRPSALAVLRLMISSTLVGLLHRQVGRLLALEDAAGVDADQTVRLRNAASVAHQAAGRGELAILVDRGHRVAERQCGELFAPADEERRRRRSRARQPAVGPSVAKAVVEIAFGAGAAGHGAAARVCGPPPACLSTGSRQTGIGRIDEQRNDGRRGDQLVQQLQPLRPDLHAQRWSRP